ncbi:MAG: ATP synthase F1 subunit delta [Vulcanimicrobiaceae bacterium]
MANEKLARRYATAVFSLATERTAVERIGRDLHAVLGAFEGDADALRFFVSPVVDRGEKARRLAIAFAQLDEVALHTVLLLVRKRREALLGPLVRAFDELEQQARGAAPLTVTSARPLPAAELDALVARIAALDRTRYDVTTVIDPKVIGGIRITMGDKRIDGTVAGRLDELARLLSTN